MHAHSAIPILSVWRKRGRTGKESREMWSGGGGGGGGGGEGSS